MAVMPPTFTNLCVGKGTLKRVVSGNPERGHIMNWGNHSIFKGDGTQGNFHTQNGDCVGYFETIFLGQKEA